MSDAAFTPEHAPAPVAWWRSRGLRNWLIALAVALVASILVRTFAFESYFIPSGSMEPTLQVGDRVMVDKLSVDFGTINIGDVIVFTSPGAVATVCGDTVPDLVKRVVALERHDEWQVAERRYPSEESVALVTELSTSSAPRSSPRERRVERRGRFTT
ncbi:MAG TPA: signal peptidase I [Acidimicrobiales bacterium]|nr:signal peptidase I [Acidimicrobiales bacterium]